MQDFSREKSVVHLRAVAQLLQDENRRLKARVKELETKLGETSGLAEENAVLAELVARAKQREFGRSSERRNPDKPDKPDEPERDPQVGHGPRDQPGLPVRDVPCELPPEERVCPCCGCERVPMEGMAEESELIHVVAQAIELWKVKRQKYVCQCEDKPITTAPGPERLQPGGRYSLVFAVHVAIAKYADHLPLDRQAQILKRDGLVIDAHTLWDQLDVLAKHLEPTYKAIVAAILRHAVIHVDETRWPVLDNGKIKENKLWQAWGLVAPELVAYCILDSRGKDAAASILGEYKGTIMADGYTVYTSLAAEKKTFVVAHCWAHTRRKHIECEKNFPQEAGVALAAIRELYAIERKATDETRCELRATESRKVVDALFAWAAKTKDEVMPRSGIGEAIGYLLNHEVGLRKFLDDPAVPLDNNACERALRALVLGRKNHYGSRSRRGTEVAAIMYTLMECARLAGVSPMAYVLAVARKAIREPGAVLLPADFKAQPEASAA